MLVLYHIVNKSSISLILIITNKKIPIFRYVSEYRDFDVLYYGVYTAVSADIF